MIWISSIHPSSFSDADTLKYLSVSLRLAPQSTLLEVLILKVFEWKNRHTTNGNILIETARFQKW